MTLNQFLSGTYTSVSWDDADAFMTTAPQIQTFDSATGKYIRYYYLTDAYVSDTESKMGWADIGGNYINPKINPGQAFWFKDVQAPCTITTAGQVLSDSSSGITTTANQWNLIANPYPMSFSLNGTSVTWVGIVGVSWDDQDAFMKTAPQIQTFNTLTGKYVRYFYLLDAYVSDTESKAGWADIGGNYVSDSIAPGQGFWFKSSATVTVTVSK